jgi:hypothetical protein
VPKESIHNLENQGPDLVYLITVLSCDNGFAELLEHAIPTPLDAEDLAVSAASEQRSAWSSPAD